MQRIGERSHEHRLAQAWDTFQQNVTTTDQADQYPSDNIVITYDHFADFVAQRFEVRTKLVAQLLSFSGRRHERGFLT